MVNITDNHGNTVAFLHSNIIIDAAQENVLGLLLGSCIFGMGDAPIGKFFNDTFRLTDGRIMARTGNEIIPHKPSNEKDLFAAAWQLLTNVKDHVCMWIVEKDEWTAAPFSMHLAANHALAKQ